MKRAKAGLQKFTETELKINAVKKKEKIKEEDLMPLSFEEREEMCRQFTQELNSLKGVERDKFIDKVEEIVPQDVKNQFWENNHFQITLSISKLIEEYGKMPTKNQIAADCGLSRQTIHKHLKTYAEHPLYAEQLTQFKFMADRVLAKVIKMAVQGNVRAASLYFDVMGGLNGHISNNARVSTQNNYIQINGMVLSQEKVRQLSADQLNQIETVLKTAANVIPVN